MNILNGEVNFKDNNFIHCSKPIITGKGNVNINNCGFVDNASSINITGDVNIKNSAFELSDKDYLDTSFVPFLDVYGDLNFDFCDFTIDLRDLDNLGYSYVMLKIGGNFKTNGVRNNLLNKNNQFKMMNNTSEINVESDDYHITSKNSKAVTWNIINSNKVFNNNVQFDYIGE